MKLVVGLGNPGRKYEGTRHNIGLDVLRELMRRHSAGKPRVRFQGEVCEAQMGNESVLLLAPHTFMNLSGSSVLPARDFYKLELQDILIVCDDFHLPLGRLRMRPTGSAGGQKGLADILRRLGTQEVSRLRLGIGDPPAGWDIADYVLSKFRPDESDTIGAAIDQAATVVAEWSRLGTAECMNRHNADPNAQKSKKTQVDETNDAKKKNKES